MYVTNSTLFHDSQNKRFKEHLFAAAVRSEVLAVGARCYPVEQLFLDDLEEQLLGICILFSLNKIGWYWRALMNKLFL